MDATLYTEVVVVNNPAVVVNSTSVTEVVGVNVVNVVSLETVLFLIARSIIIVETIVIRRIVMLKTAKKVDNCMQNFKLYRKDNFGSSVHNFWLGHI